MLVLELVLALLLGLVISFVLTRVAGRRGPGPWSGFLFFFGLVALAIWAGGVWLTPIGPMIGGVYWMPFLLVGVIVLLFLAAATKPVRKPIKADAATTPGEQKAEMESVATTAFFWLLIFGLLGAIFARYIVRGT